MRYGNGTPTVLLTTAFPTPASDMWAPTVGRAWSSACGIWPDWTPENQPFERQYHGFNGVRGKAAGFPHATWLRSPTKSTILWHRTKLCARIRAAAFSAQGATAIPRHRLWEAGRAASGPARARGRSDGLRRPSAGQAGCEIAPTTIRQTGWRWAKCVQPAGQSDERCCRKQGAAASQLIVRGAPPAPVRNRAHEDQKAPAAIPVESAFFCASPPAGCGKGPPGWQRRDAPGGAPPASACSNALIHPTATADPLSVPPARTLRRTRGSPAAGRKAAPAPGSRCSSLRAPSRPVSASNTQERALDAQIAPQPPAQRVYL